MQWVEFVEEILGTDPQISSLSGLSYSGNANKVVRVNAGESGFELAAVSGGGGGVGSNAGTGGGGGAGGSGAVYVLSW